MGKTLTLDPYACIDVAHREKTAPLGFCESIFSDKRCNLSLPTCLCSAHAGHLLLSDRGAARLRCPWTAPKSRSLHRRKLCSDQLRFTDKEREMEEL